MSVCPLGEWGLWDPWVLLGRVLCSSVGRPCSSLGKGKGVSVTSWFSSGSRGFYRSPLGVGDALQDTRYSLRGGCPVGHVGLFMGEGRLCQYLDPLWGSVGDWIPFGGVGVRVCGIPGSLSWDAALPDASIAFRGNSFRAWVGVTPLWWWVGSAGPLRLVQP